MAITIANSKTETERRFRLTATRRSRGVITAGEAVLFGRVIVLIFTPELSRRRIPNRNTFLRLQVCVKWGTN